MKIEYAEIIGTVSMTDWYKLQDVANERGVDIKEVVGDVVSLGLGVWFRNKSEEQAFASTPFVLSKYDAEVIGTFASKNGVDFDQASGMIWRRGLNNAARDVGGETVCVVVSQKRSSGERALVRAAFTDRQSAEVYMDGAARYENTDRDFWIEPVKLNEGKIQWWSVRYQFTHKPGWSAMASITVLPSDPYNLEWFEGGFSLYVVADSEEKAIERGRLIAKGQL